MNPRLEALFALKNETHEETWTNIYTEGEIFEITAGDHRGVRILIVKTEFDERFGHAVHVSVKGSLMTPGGSVLDAIPHLPFRPDALEATPLHKVGQLRTIPDDWKGMYQDWQSDVEDGEAGLFILPVDEIISDILARLPVF